MKGVIEYPAVVCSTWLRPIQQAGKRKAGYRNSTSSRGNDPPSRPNVRITLSASDRPCWAGCGVRPAHRGEDQLL